MTTKTKTPNTLSHTRDMLESILRPHSLEELYALVGSFPFKAVKVCRSPKLPPNIMENTAVGAIFTVLEFYWDSEFFTVEGSNGLAATPKTIKQWRLAE